MNLNWKNFFIKEKKKIYFINLKKYLYNEIKKKKIILPSLNDIFNAFKFTNFNNLKVVIIGQDPYYKINQANGLAFSVNKNIKIPPSLLNIYNELYRSISYFKYPNHGLLLNWCNQGVLLLNRILTVENNKPKSHINIGWEIFTNNAISFINNNLNSIIFMLWGSYAKKVKKLINNKKHYILESSHPSPLSVNKGFIGCNHFFISNNILIKNNKIINWNL
ncbi:uracil-DNA glycosylase [endosymbiont of Sipalinus gigas]|uniref:uracil-DNA glycosylase n=1 Tax=endosymbiont of Sipalinus gigas TaxID=1972134 RepID=UPI000DC73572|nr:uracil-DNA glycosylase [endosymbiont of Sipalinus gigas]BBA85200.1 uracil-DNA glycosylase [endosymbiont of Sipalinus gigas]